MRQLFRRGGFAVLLGAMLFSSSVALAALPTNAPTTIRSFGFESASDSATMTPSAGAKAFWGRVTNDKHSGSASAWCAGRLFPSLSASGAWPTYLPGTAGDLRVSVPELADYYSSTLSFWYKMSSIGSEDRAILLYGDHILNLKRTSSWTNIQSSFATREKSGGVVIKFVDNAEQYSQQLGTGPLVDDLTIKGFMFAPVNGISVARTVADAPLPVAVSNSTSLLLTGNTAANIVTWGRPLGSAIGTTADTRDIFYRVWRRDSKGQWTELTDSSKPLSAEKFVDAPAAGTYAYAVQPFGADGKGRGMYVERDVTVSGAIDSAGVASVTYSVDGGTTQTANATSVSLGSVATDGKSHIVRFFVTDTNGVSSDVQTVNVAKKATISVAKSNISVGYHKGATVTAYLKNSSGTGLKGYTLYAQILSGGTWKTVAQSTALSTAGSYQLKLPYWETSKPVHIVLAPSTSYAAVAKTVYVRPQVIFSTIAYSTTSPRAYRTFSVSGAITPAHSGEVRVTAYKVVGTSLTAVKTVKVTSRTSGYFSANFSLAKGTYRFKASHGSTTSTTENALTVSPLTAKVTVR